MSMNSGLTSVRTGMHVGIEVGERQEWAFAQVVSVSDNKETPVVRVLDKTRFYEFSIETGVEVNAAHGGRPCRLTSIERLDRHNNAVMLRNRHTRLKRLVDAGSGFLIGEIDFLEKKLTEIALY